MFKYRRSKKNLTEKLKELGFDCIVLQYLYRNCDGTEIKMFNDKCWRIIVCGRCEYHSTKLSKIYEYLTEMEKTNERI